MQGKVKKNLFSSIIYSTFIISIMTAIHLSNKTGYIRNILNQNMKISPVVHITQSGMIIPHNKKSITKGWPVRLIILKIHINATIEGVGLTPNGSMDVPKDRLQVGWFQSGTIPGQIGSAVIAGHYGIRKNGDISIFQNLHMLDKRDIVSVEDDQGLITNFKVTKIVHYDENANTSSVFRSNDGKSHLNIITCVWNQKSHSYSQRLVVFTEKVN